MARLSLAARMILLIGSLGGSLSATHLSIEDLSHTLERIDMLKGYGPVVDSRIDILTQYGVEEILSQSQVSTQECMYVYAFAAQLLSRYAYSDGSYRSRIYAQAQQRLISLLMASDYGKALLEVLAQDFPVIDLYVEVLK